MSKRSISTLGVLRQAVERGEVAHRTVQEEVRENLIQALRGGGALFPGIIGYDDTVVPQLVNALLSQHNFILLGLRGQAKTRLLRALVTLLDEEIPVMAGCEINDDPLAPICASCRARIASEGDSTPVEWLHRDLRYVEKLATPDVTIADMVGDIDPIKAAKSGLQLSSELTMHYGLLPRANRGIFAINELPDLAGKIQVGLFNILQEGDVQIKGYPVRLPLDVMMAFTANPEDYTARGKIITPLKDRIGSEIRTHYPSGRTDAMAITAQEAWMTGRNGAAPRASVPTFVAEIVEEIAFQARQDRRVDKRSGVSQRLPISAVENVVSNAERRAIASSEPEAVARVTDVYAALPSITGKFEMEYEGELKGRRDRGSRSHPRRSGNCRRRISLASRNTRRDRVVRPWRQPAAERHHERQRRAHQRPSGAGGLSSCLRCRHSGAVVRTAARIGHRLRARRSLRYEEDQPQRRTRLSRD
jgi:magnesium chelatase subunit I